jgi:hypothetical protein
MNQTSWRRERERLFSRAIGGADATQWTTEGPSSAEFAERGKPLRRRRCFAEQAEVVQ